MLSSNQVNLILAYSTTPLARQQIKLSKVETTASIYGYQREINDIHVTQKYKQNQKKPDKIVSLKHMQASLCLAHL